MNADSVDRCKNAGITTTMKGSPSFTPNQLKHLENAGWIMNNEVITDVNGNFDVLIPLRMVIGFGEDYLKIVIDVKHELILTRSNSDRNAVIQTGNSDNFIVTIKKIEWLMPHVILSDFHKVEMYKYVSSNPSIAMSFRSWDLYEYPILPQNSRQVWTVKTTNQLEKPRYVILGFQTNRNNVMNANASKFDHCNITNVKLFLNSQAFPHANMNLNINENKYALLYEMFTRFQCSYYEKKHAKPIISKANFIADMPLIVIDCSKQNESVKFGPVDVRLEFESSGNFPANTTAFCLIIHDRIIEYKPISGEIKKLI